MQDRVVSWMGLILVGVALNAGAQIALKYGAAPISKTDLAWTNTVQIARALAASWPIWLGLSLYAASLVNWVIVLSRVDVSAAYPFLSLGYVVALVWGYYGFQEPIGVWRIIGIGLVILGTFCLART